MFILSIPTLILKTKIQKKKPYGNGFNCTSMGSQVQPIFLYSQGKKTLESKK
jgi:hypothetical protein